MFLNNQNQINTTSTPKRRRLGTQRIVRRKNETILSDFSPRNFKSQFSVENVMGRCDSPPLPCNQVEYLCDSNTSSASDIPCSPDVLSSSITKNSQKWESLVIGTNQINKLCDKDLSRITSNLNKIEEIDEISEEMFNSNIQVLEQSKYFSCEQKSSKLQQDVEESFDLINQSICQLDNVNKCDKSSLFDTKDSFLLDIRESGIICEDKQSSVIKPKPVENVINLEGFYGLPVITKGLFKTYRNIEKFYDWQEECLNLPAIRERRNLIYALPTSGGKTLVAEVLMLREVLVRKNNALFILPFVAVVQEKIWALSPFAVQLEFLVEEYAAGKGHLPPKKRRKKHSIYIATIEKALALVRSLIELDRLDEIGLIVVDELHLIGENGRGGTLEMLLSTVLFTKPNIQIVGMSATIGNLDEIAKFLRADIFTREFRPVELKEYVKIGDMLYKLMWGDQLEIVPCEELKFDYSESGRRRDPDGLAALVWRRAAGGCLVFCPTKRNCENVATLLCQMYREPTTSQSAERGRLSAALRSEGAARELCEHAKHGVAYHHAGLAQDERALLEQAFRAGVLRVLCCTSTLAAGVNLPAARVVVRSPRVGREALSLAAYRQMVGRAGRAGHCDTGESIIICPPSEWPQLRAVLSGGLLRALSQLSAPALLLSAVALKLASTKGGLRKLMDTTLMGVQCEGNTIDSSINTKTICENALRELLQSDALEIVGKDAPTRGQPGPRECKIYDDTEFGVSTLGQAAINGCIDLSTAKQLLNDLEIASRSLVLMGSLHLLYLVTPHDGAGIKPDYRHYYSLYCNLDNEGHQTAKILGITEGNAIRMITGKPITNVSEKVLCRFYLAMMLHDVCKQVPLPIIAEKYSWSRGGVCGAVWWSTMYCGSVARVCGSAPRLWPFAALLTELAERLRCCAAPELHALLELPAVGKARALQLVKAGYKRIEDIAKASAENLMSSVTHLSRTTANHLISAARLMLIEKVENLRAEAEEVMDELNL